MSNLELLYWTHIWWRFCEGILRDVQGRAAGRSSGAGAFVFYDCLCSSEKGPVNWGHCGVSLGDGRVIHEWDMVRIDDYLAIEKLTVLTGDHPEYLGWVVLERVLNQKPRV